MPNTSWEHFITSGFTPRDRLSGWTRWGERMFGSMRVRPNDPRGFFGEASWTDFGPLTVSEFRFTPSHAENPLSEDDQGLDDAIIVSLPQQGNCIYRNGQHVTAIGEGDLYVRDLSQPWQMKAEGVTRLITLRIPFADFAARFGDPAAFVNRPHSGRRAEVGFASAMIRSALDMLRTDADAGRRAVLADTVLDGLRLLRDGESSAAAETTALSLRRKAILHVARNLGDPELSPAGVARALDVSPRELQRAFQKSGETLQGVILEQRLDRGAALLSARPGQYRNGITRLAIALGFSDAAYFTRAFTRRHGIAPSRYMAARMG